MKDIKVTIFSVSSFTVCDQLLTNLWSIIRAPFKGCSTSDASIELLKMSILSHNVRSSSSISTLPIQLESKRLLLFTQDTVLNQSTIGFYLCNYFVLLVLSNEN